MCNSLFLYLCLLTFQTTENEINFLIAAGMCNTVGTSE